MGAVGVAKRRATEGGGSMKTFGRGAFGLGSALVVVFCAGASACSMGASGDDPPTASAPLLGTVTLPVVAASALPQGLGARLGKKCGSALPAAASAVLFGPNAAPPKLSELRRVIPEPTGGKARPFEIVGGRIPIKEARASAARETVGTHANEPAVLTSADGKMTVGISLRGASSASAVASDGHIVYPGGLPSADIVQRPTGDGAEDWLLFASAPPVPRVEYDVALTSGVAAVRLSGRSIELLDTNGVPRLRMAPPVLVDDECITTPVDVAITGCQVDTSPSDPRRKPHPAPAAPSCRVALTWPSQRVKYPIALDPSWSSAASMASARAYHSAIRLPGSDRVLVAGGLGAGPYNVLASTEVYDPDTDTWASYGTLGTARYAHAMTSFADGTILLAGGLDAYGAPTATAEATTGTGYFPRASMPGPAAGLTLDPLSSEWAIAAGGYRFVGGALRTTADAPVYYKAADQWYARTMPGGSRGWHASLATSTGVTFFGGERNDGTYSVLSSVVRYNSGVDTFSTLTSMPVARTKAGAALLASGTAIVAGGEGAGGVALGTTHKAPLPATSPWAAGPNLLGDAIRPAVTGTGEETLVTTGGYRASTVLDDTRLFASLTDGHAGGNLHTPRYAHTATATATGRVLVAGGVGADGSATSSAEWISDTTCNQGASEPPLAPSWGALAPGLYSSATTRVVTVANTTAQPLSGSLAIRAEGLDGREVSRTVWSGSIAAGASAEVVVAYATLPIQSTNAKAMAELVAQVTSAPAGHEHLVGVSAHTPKLAYTFDATYDNVDLAGASWESPTVLEGVTSQADIVTRMGPLALGLQTVTGKMWDGTQMVDIATVGANLIDSVAVQHATQVFSNADKSLFDIFPAPTAPNSDQLSGIKVCARLRAYYIDDNKGESVYFDGRAPTAFARTELYEVLADGSSSLLWAGSADENGCAPRLSSVVVGHGYLLKTESRLRYVPRNVDIDVRDPIVPGTGGGRCRAHRAGDILLDRRLSGRDLGDHDDVLFRQQPPSFGGHRPGRQGGRPELEAEPDHARSARPLSRQAANGEEGRRHRMPLRRHALARSESARSPEPQRPVEVRDRARVRARHHGQVRRIAFDLPRQDMGDLQGPRRRCRAALLFVQTRRRRKRAIPLHPVEGVPRRRCDRGARARRHCEYVEPERRELQLRLLQGTSLARDRRNPFCPGAGLVHPAGQVPRDSLLGGGSWHRVGLDELDAFRNDRHERDHRG